MWLLLAFTGPVFWALSTHIDKYLVARYFPRSDTAVLMVFTALINILLLPPIAWLVPAVFDVHVTDALVLALSGILYMAAMLFYLRAIQGDEASVVAPLFQASTLFTFLFAWLLLGETLTVTSACGGALIVAGALLVSFEFGERRRFKLRLVLLMLACTSVLALSSVIFKYFAVRDRFWVTAFWSYAGEIAFGVGIIAVRHYRAEFVALLKRSPGPVIAVNGANELINLGAALGVRYAFLLAPIALVSAISSTTTLFVFAFGVLITHWRPQFGRENLSRRNLVQKGIAAALIAGGVALVGEAGS